MKKKTEEQEDNWDDLEIFTEKGARLAGPKVI